MYFNNIVMKDIIVFTDGSTLNNQKKGSRKGGVGRCIFS